MTTPFVHFGKIPENQTYVKSIKIFLQTPDNPYFPSIIVGGENRRLNLTVDITWKGD